MRLIHETVRVVPVSTIPFVFDKTHARKKQPTPTFGPFGTKTRVCKKALCCSILKPNRASHTVVVRGDITISPEKNTSPPQTTTKKSWSREGFSVVLRVGSPVRLCSKPCCLNCSKDRSHTRALSAVNGEVLANSPQPLETPTKTPTQLMVCHDSQKLCLRFQVAAAGEF